MRTLSILLAFVLGTASLVSCGITQGRNASSLSAEQVEERDVAPLSNIRVGGAIKARVYYSQNSRVVIRSNSPERMRGLRIDSRGKTLALSEQHSMRDTGRSYLVVEVYTDRLEELRAEQASSIELLDSFESRSLSILGSDGAQIVLDRLAELNQLSLKLRGGSVLEANVPLRAKRLEVEGVGGTILRLRGNAERLELELSGASTLEGSRLQVDKADIKLEGSALAKVEVSSALSYKLSGASRLQLSGSPRSIKGKVSGSARILQ